MCTKSSLRTEEKCEAICTDNCAEMASEHKRGRIRDNECCAKYQALPMSESETKQHFAEVKQCCSVKHDGNIQFCCYLLNICEGLTNDAEWKMSLEAASKAYSPLKAIPDSEFIVSLFTLGDVLVITLPLSHLLQSPTLDSVNASNSVRNLITVLEEKRNEVEYTFQTIFINSESVANEMEIAIVKPRISSKRQEHINNYHSDTPEEYFRRSMYTSLLDEILTNLRNRYQRKKFSHSTFVA
ncbi:hypothetical protein PR048_005483 [Dryococelus australis]|uniref:Uncharacterized protein n=1 Tax=Dryococelus australis TaxID=614101 RepID=A0ABQ9I8B8_9NEOP|nr:hypothetical protein PR048_005483 [Dryococelus australis]